MFDTEKSDKNGIVKLMILLQIGIVQPTLCNRNAFA